MTDISHPTVKEVVSLSGNEFTPILGDDGTFSKVRTSTISSTANASKLRKFKTVKPVYPITRGRVLDTMSDSGYTLTPGGGTAVAVTDNDVYYGTQDFVLTTGTAGVASFTVARQNNIGRTLDVSGGQWVGFDFSTPDPTTIDTFQFYLGDTNLTNFYKWNDIINDLNARHILPNQRVRITFPLALTQNAGGTNIVPSVTGAPNLNAVNSWQVRIAGKAGVVASVRLGRIFFMDKPPAAAVLTMDDSYASWSTLAKPILDKYGFRTTLFAIRDYSDPTIPGFVQSGGRLTESQIEKFLEGGHELGFHMKGNHLGQDSTPVEVEQECIDFKKWAKTRFGIDHIVSMAYPGGETGVFTGPTYPEGSVIWASSGAVSPLDGLGFAVDTTVSAGVPRTQNVLKPTWRTGDQNITIESIIKRHFPLGRTIVRGTIESDPPATASLVRCFLYQFGSGASQTTPTINQANIDTIIANGGVGIYSFHELVSGASTKSTEYNLADFQTTLAYLVSAGVNVLPMGEAYTRTL